MDGHYTASSKDEKFWRSMKKVMLKFRTEKGWDDQLTDMPTASGDKQSKGILRDANRLFGGNIASI